MKVIFSGTDAEIVALCARIGAIAQTGEKPAVGRDAEPLSYLRRQTDFLGAVLLVENGKCVSKGIGAEYTIFKKINGQIMEYSYPEFGFEPLDCDEVCVYLSDYFTDELERGGYWFEVADPTEGK